MQDKNNIDNQYTDFAWGEMSKVLDKEMPQKKRKRTIFFWLFGFVMLAGVSILILIYYNNRNEDSTEVAALSFGENVVAESKESIQQTRLTDNVTKQELDADKIIDKELQSRKEEKVTQVQTKNSINTNVNTLPTKQPESQRINQNAAQNKANKVAKNNRTPYEKNESKILINRTPIINNLKTTDAKEEVENVLNNKQIEENKAPEEAVRIDQQTTKEKKNQIDPAKKDKPSIVESKDVVESTIKESIKIEQPTIRQQVEDLTLDESLAKETNSEAPKSEEDEVKVEVTKEKKWSFGVNTSIYVNKDFEYINDWASSAFVKRDLNNKFALSLGLGYTNFFFENSEESNLRSATSDDMSMPELDADPNGMLDSMNSTEIVTSRSRIRSHFINVPIALHYKINRKIGLETGVGFEFLLNPSEVEVVKSINPYYHAGFNFYVNNKLNLGLSYKLLGSRFESKNDDRSLQNVPQPGAFDLSVSKSIIKNYNHLFGLKLGYTF